MLTSARGSGGRGPRAHARGLRVLAQLAACSILRVVRQPVTTPLQQRGVKGLLHQVAHTAGVYGFFATLARELAAVPGATLHWWETGARCERVFVWREQTYHFKPDAFAGVHLAGRTVRFWLEWDRSTISTKDLAEKFASYQYYIRAREWAREHQILPWLLIVVPNHDQESPCLTSGLHPSAKLGGTVSLDKARQLRVQSGFRGPLPRPT